MKVYRDPVDGFVRIKGYEDHHFTSESDAETAMDFAIDFARQELFKESRYRRAAERAGEKASA